MAQRNLWAPWRISYLQSLGGEADDQPQGDGKGGGCFLCAAAEPGLDTDTMCDRLVLLSDERGSLLMNRYPYSNGHLLAAPREHVADISDLTPDGRAGLMELADLGNRLLKLAMHCQGVNLGMNLGRSAGAGVPGHCHMHLVPRWNGDVNFMQTVAGARVIPQALEASYDALCAALAQEQARG